MESRAFPYSSKALASVSHYGYNEANGFNVTQNEGMQGTMGKDDSLTFGERLRRLRKQRKLTQAELAGAVGVSGEAISHYETGTDKPGGETLLKLADYFDVHPAELLGAPTNKEPVTGITPEWERVLRLAAQYNLPPREVLLAIETYRQVLDVLKPRS